MELAKRHDAKDLEVLATIVQAALDSKGQRVLALDCRNFFALADYFILVSGTSDRQVQGISNRIINALHPADLKPTLIEGFEKGHWVVLDYGNYIVHVLYEPTRELFQLEKLWHRAQTIPLQIDGRGNAKLEAA
jgi:ribosome-associated protein